VKILFLLSDSEALLCLVFHVETAHATLNLNEKEQSIQPSWKASEEGLEDLFPLPGEIVQNFRNGGLDVHLELSVDEKYLFCFIGANDDILYKFAEFSSTRIPINTDTAVKEGRKINFSLAMHTSLDGGIEFFDDEQGIEHEKLSIDLWDYITLPFKQNLSRDLYMHLGPQEDVLLDRTQRLLLLWEIVQDSCPEVLEVLGTSHAAHEIFPLDFEPQHTPLRERFEKMDIPSYFGRTWVDILDEIEAYYGSDIAFYFSFLGFYSSSLLLPAIGGLITFLWQISSGSVAPPGIWFPIALLLLWSELFCEFYKRFAFRLAVTWHVVSFSSEPPLRPQFEGVVQISPIDGEFEKVAESWIAQYCRLFLSYTVVSFFTCLSAAAILSLYIVADVTSSMWAMVLGSLNATQIMILGYIYYYLVEYLNDFENHRNEAAHANSMIFKQSVFNIIASFNSLYYIAFIQEPPFKCPHPEDDVTCENETHDFVMREVRMQLASLFITMIFIQNFIELYFDVMYKYAMAFWESGDVHSPRSADHRRRRTHSKVPPTFRAIGSPDRYNDILRQADAWINAEESPDKLDNVLELFVQYGYVTLFAMAFPLTPALAFANNMLEIWIDGHKLTTCRRPFPRQSGGFDQAWLEMFSWLSMLAVLTNVALFVWRTDNVYYVFGTRDPTTKMEVFGISSAVILAMLAIIREAVNDKPSDVQDFEDRESVIEEYLVTKAEFYGEKALRKQRTLTSDFENRGIV